MSCSEQQTVLETRLGELVEDLKEESLELEKEVRERAGTIDPDIDTSGPDVWIGLDIDVSWERVDFSLDLPEIKLVNQEWSLDLPQVTMKQQTIIFHTPSVRMDTVRGPDLPETVCKMVMKQIGPLKTKVPECKIRMKKTYLDVPVTFMQEQKIILDVPEFKMDRTEMVVGVPEFTMKTQKFALHLPQVTVKNIHVEAKKAEKAGNELAADAKRRGEELRLGFAETAKSELGTDVSDLYGCYRQQLLSSRTQALQTFEHSAATLQNAITSMVNNKVPEDNENLKSARASQAKLAIDRESFLTQMQENLEKLAAQESTFFEKLVSQD